MRLSTATTGQSRHRRSHPAARPDFSQKRISRVTLRASTIGVHVRVRLLDPPGNSEVSGQIPRGLEGRPVGGEARDPQLAKPAPRCLQTGASDWVDAEVSSEARRSAAPTKMQNLQPRRISRSRLLLSVKRSGGVSWIHVGRATIALLESDRHDAPRPGVYGDVRITLVAGQW